MTIAVGYAARTLSLIAERIYAANLRSTLRAIERVA